MRVVPGFSGRTLNALGVPDHLLSEMVKYALLFCFHLMPTDSDHIRVEIFILDALHTNCLPNQQNSMRWDRAGLFKV